MGSGLKPLEVWKWGTLDIKAEILGVLQLTLTVTLCGFFTLLTVYGKVAFLL